MVYRFIIEKAGKYNNMICVTLHTWGGQNGNKEHQKIKALWI